MWRTNPTLDDGAAHAEESHRMPPHRPKPPAGIRSPSRAPRRRKVVAPRRSGGGPSSPQRYPAPIVPWDPNVEFYEGDRFGERATQFLMRPPPNLPPWLHRRQPHEDMLTPEIAMIVVQRAELAQRAADTPGFADTPERAAKRELARLQAQLAEQQGDAAPAAALAPEQRVTILVEMNCQQGLLSMRHDPLKYDRYFREFEEAMGTEIVSPDGKRRIGVTLEATAAVLLFDETDAMCSFPNASRYGAFEVYLVSHLTDAEDIPRCSGVFSKLLSRRWPNVTQIVQRCRDMMQPAFDQWDADDELRAELPKMASLDQANILLGTYSGRVHSTLRKDLEGRQQTLKNADSTLKEAIENGDIPTLRKALEISGELASPDLVFQATLKLQQMEMDEALRRDNEAIANSAASAADREELRAAIASYRERATAEAIAIAEERLRVLDANHDLREAVEPLVEASEIRVVIEQHRDGASIEVVEQALAKLVAVQAADTALTEAMATDIPTLTAAISTHRAKASPTVVAEAEVKLTQLEADEALELAIEDADAALAAYPPEVPLERRQTLPLGELIKELMLTKQTSLDAIDIHSTLATNQAVADTHERLLVIDEDVARLEEMLLNTSKLAEAAAPLNEASELRACVERFKGKTTDEGMEAVEARLQALDATDKALTAAMEKGDIPGLKAAISQLRSKASPTIVVKADAKLLQLEADLALSIACRLTKPELIRAAMDEHKEHASPEGWKAIEQRYVALQNAGEAITKAYKRSVPDIKLLSEALAEHTAAADPDIVAEARTVLAEWVADDALRRAQLESDISRPETPQSLHAAIKAHYPPARYVVVAEVETLVTLSNALIRELEADGALEKLIVSKGYEEAASIQKVLDKHGHFAATPLVTRCLAKLHVLAEADAALLAVVTEALREPEHDEDGEVEVDVNADLIDAVEEGKPKLPKKQPQPKKTAADIIFQGLADYGPFASRSVRLAAWRQGGTAVCMPIPETPEILAAKAAMWAADLSKAAAAKEEEEEEEEGEDSEEEQLEPVAEESVEDAAAAAKAAKEAVEAKAAEEAAAAAKAAEDAAAAKAAAEEAAAAAKRQGGRRCEAAEEAAAAKAAEDAAAAKAVEEAAAAAKAARRPKQPRL